MKNLEKILVPTDFSPSCSRALRRAIELAQRDDAEVVLLHVIDESSFPSRHVLRTKSVPNLHDEMLKGSKQRMEDLVRDEIGDKTKYRAEVVEGIPAETVADFAQREKIDLIVMANRGHTGFRRFLLGSTTERVVRIAPCSVLVIRDEQ